MSYGFCPECGAKGVQRERRPNGNDKCENGHVYPSKSAITEKVAPKKSHMRLTYEDGLKKGYIDGYHAAAECADTVVLRVAPELDSAIGLGVSAVSSILRSNLSKIETTP